MSGEGLHFLDARAESPGGIAQGGLGIDLAVAGEVDDGEEKIPELPGEGGPFRTGMGKFPEFLADFGGDAFGGIRPVEAGAGGAALEVLGVEQGGEMARNPV